MADLTSPEVGHALIPVGTGWFDQVARIAAKDISRRDSLRLAAGVTATAFAASWVRPGRVRAAAGDPGCGGTRTAYSDGCAKPVPKQNYTASSNGCGPENGVVAIPQTPAGIATFTPACNTHDVCYGTCNSSRSKCDSDFHKDMLEICTNRYPTGGLLDSIGRGLCFQLAGVYAGAVSTAGSDAFKTGQTEGCDCCQTCPDGQPLCGDRCCQDGHECSNGACCAPCENYIKCSFSAPPGQCDYGCCNPSTICCPHPNGMPRCCPAEFCCAGVCTTC